jgi:hypothetical protein
MAAKEAPIPMPACAPVDNEAGLLEGEELDENVVAERTLGWFAHPRVMSKKRSERDWQE